MYYKISLRVWNAQDGYVLRWRALATLGWPPLDAGPLHYRG
jgi:hypothetical protein